MSFCKQETQGQSLRVLPRDRTPSIAQLNSNFHVSLDQTPTVISTVLAVPRFSRYLREAHGTEEICFQNMKGNNTDRTVPASVVNLRTYTCYAKK